MKIICHSCNMKNHYNWEREREKETKSQGDWARKDVWICLCLNPQLRPNEGKAHVLPSSVSVVFNATDSLVPRQGRQLCCQVISFPRLQWWIYFKWRSQAIIFLTVGSYNTKGKIWLSWAGEMCVINHGRIHKPTVNCSVTFLPLGNS